MNSTNYEAPFYAFFSIIRLHPLVRSLCWVHK